MHAPDGENIGGADAASSLAPLVMQGYVFKNTLQFVHQTNANIVGIGKAIMDYTKEDIETIIEQSCDFVKDQQPMLFMEKHDIHERTLAAELKSAMENWFKEFHVNCEYNRMPDENGVQIPKRIGLDPDPEDPSSVYPDIIVHRQEDGKHNLLIVEIKMSWKNHKKEKDIEKLNLYIQELKYKYGLYLEIGEEGISDREWFE
ncbi:MAG: hypothetical protein LWX08_05800 [Deltaproteobacteria bacterium]|nr:hypothetical protein [Deltaproteobacteria bacterium]